MRKPRYLIGQRVRLRLAQASDAAFIWQLRHIGHKAAFLNTSTDTIAAQADWLEKCQTDANQIYFIVEDLNTDEALGTIRIYDAIAIPKPSISIGSWVMQDGTPPKSSLESLNLVVQYILHLGFEHCHFGVQADNYSVLNFHRKLGAQCATAQGAGLVLHNQPRLFLSKMQPRYGLPSQHLQIIPAE
jgi:RimJ/RimL family protein N-acetyltransferase